MAIRYTTRELLNLFGRMTQPMKRVTTTVYHNITQLGICSVSLTHRGTTGGGRDHFVTNKTISTRVSTRCGVASISNPRTNGINMDNLKRVPIRNIASSVTRNLHVLCINTRSVKNKATSVADLAISHNIDVLALTETWLGSDIDKQVVSQLVPIGYKIHAVSRCKEKRGGGVALMYKAGLQVKSVTTGVKYTHFEHSDYYITSAGVTFRLGVVYRPSPSRKNGFVNAVFFDDWSAYLDGCMLDPHEIVIAGDLNFHLDTKTAPDVRRLSETLADHGMVQLVTDATHNNGHILDVVIVRINCELYTHLGVYTIHVYVITMATLLETIMPSCLP